MNSCIMRLKIFDRRISESLFDSLTLTFPGNWRLAESSVYFRLILTQNVKVYKERRINYQGIKLQVRGLNGSQGSS